MISVQEINSIDALAGLRLLWNSLLSGTRGATFFQSLDWLETYWRHYGADQTLRVLVVSAAGKPQGILPLTIRTEQTSVGSVRVLTYPLHDWAAFFGPIGPNPTLTLIAAMDHIRSTPRDWDLLDLRWVNTDGADHGRTCNAMRLAGFNPRKRIWMEAAEVDLSEGWDAYWASRKSHWRTNVRRTEKKLSERGEVTHVRYRPLGRAQGDCDPRWDLYDACERLARNSWQGTSTTGTTLTHDEVRAYFRDAHARAADAGALDLNLLLVDGTPAAFAYNYHYQGMVTGLRMGYDHAVARDGAGTLLQYKMLQDSCQRGDHTYDLGAQYLDCKRQWQSRIAASYRYTHYAPTLRSQALRAGHWLNSRMQEMHSEPALAT